MSYIGLQALTTSQIEAYCRKYFAQSIAISHVVAANIDCNHDRFATVFYDQHDQLYTLIFSNNSMTLGDVRKIVSAIGMKAEGYFVPEAHSQYFYNYAKDVFQAVYPNRTSMSTEDLSYYQTLAPYNPALVKVKAVESELRSYKTMTGQWMKLADFSYHSPAGAQ